MKLQGKWNVPFQNNRIRNRRRLAVLLGAGCWIHDVAWNLEWAALGLLCLFYRGAFKEMSKLRFQWVDGRASEAPLFIIQSTNTHTHTEGAMDLPRLLPQLLFSLQQKPLGSRVTPANRSS